MFQLHGLVPTENGKYGKKNWGGGGAWNLESLVEFTDLLNLTRFLPFVTKVKKLAVSFCGMHLLNSDENYCVCKLRLQFRTLILQKLTCHFFHNQLSH